MKNQATTTLSILAMLAAGITAASLSAAEDSRPQPADPGEGYRMLYIGNSLTGQLNNNQIRVDGRRPQVDGRNLATLTYHYVEAGFSAATGQGVGAAGIPIDWAWTNHGKREEFFQALEDKEFDALTVQTFGFQNRRDPETEAYAAAQFYRALLEETPDAPLFVYQTWPSGRAPGGAHFPDLGPGLEEGGGSAEVYIEGLGHARKYADRIAHLLRQKFPDRPVYTIPCPQVFIEFQERLEASSDGEFAGMRHIAELLDKGGWSVHTSRKGVFLVAMTHLAATYGINPAETDLPEDYETVFAFNNEEGMQPTGLSPDDMRELAQLAWDVVSETPGTMVSGEPLPQEAHPAPSVNADLDVEATGPRQATVTWEMDGDMSEVSQLVIYANGDLQARLEPDAREARLTDLIPGQANEIALRALNEHYTYAEFAATAETPAMAGQPLISWDVHPFAAANRAEGFKLEPDAELPAVDVADGIQAGDALTLQRGPGLSQGNSNFKGVFTLGGAAKTFADAVADEDYITVTVAPESGSRLSLGGLEVPGRGIGLAVFSSATGWEADDVLGQAALPDSIGHVAFDLSTVEALQGIDSPVELRLYVWQRGRHTLLGSGSQYSPVNNQLQLIGEVE